MMTEAAEKPVVKVVNVAEKPNHEDNCTDISVENCASERERFNANNVISLHVARSSSGFTLEVNMYI